MFFKIDPPLRLTTYDTFADYLSSDDLTVYVDNGHDDVPIGNIPRHQRVEQTQNEVLVTLSYDEGVLPDEIPETHKNYVFNGADLLFSKGRIVNERLYVPMTIVTHLGEGAYKDSYNIDIVTTKNSLITSGITYRIPAKSLAENAVLQLARTYKALHQGRQRLITLDYWDFESGVLHVYTKLIDKRETTVLVKNGDDGPVLTYRVDTTPSLSFSKTKPLIRIADDVDELLKQMVPNIGTYWDVEKVVRRFDDNDREELFAYLTVDRTTYDEELTATINDFVNYLTYEGITVPDNLCHGYLKNTKKERK